MDLYIAIFLAAALCAAVFTDLREQRIPNALTFSLAIFALGYHTAIHGLDGLLFSLAGLGLGFVLMFIPHLFGVMGGGDVKLMAGAGACLGWELTLEAFLCTCLAGGVYALAILLFRPAMLRQVLRNFRDSIWLLMASKRGQYAPIQGGEALPRLCYGVAIAVGTGAVMLHEALRTGML